MAASDIATPAPAAAPAAAAPVSAPAPVAPAAAPAAPVTAPETPAAPAAPQGPRADETNTQYLRRTMLEKQGKPGDTPDPSPLEYDPDGDLADPDKQPVVDGAEKPADGEAKPDDVVPAEAKPDEKPADEAVDPAADELRAIDEPDIVATSELAAKLKDPEVQAALEKAGISRDSLFATARIAAKGQKVLDLFNGDVETAETAVKQAEDFGRLSQMFAGQRDPSDTIALLREFQQFSFELDEEGNPVLGADGQPKSDGTVGRMVDNVFKLGLDGWLKEAETSGDADLKAACEILQGKYDKVTGSAKPDYSHLDDDTKARLETADTREKEVAAREAAETARKEKEFETNVTSRLDQGLDKDIDTLLSNAKLSEGQKKWARDQIKERVSEKLKNSTLFFNKLDVIMRRPMTEKTMGQRVAHGLNSARPLLGGRKGVVAEVLAELGAQIETKQTTEQQRLATQKTASRSEIKSGSQPAKPGTVPGSAEIIDMAEKELRAEGKDPNNTTLMFQQVGKVKRRLGLA